jgi:hypothetical protein
MLTTLGEFKMQYGWVMDVLADLKGFAHQNGMPRLAEELDDVAMVAAVEIEAKKRVAKVTVLHEQAVGIVFRGDGAHKNAG